MSVEDRRRWDERHAAAAAEGRVEGASSLLAAVEAWLPRSGRALDVASGRGAASVALARRGLEVVAVDVSPVGLAEVARRAAAAGVAARVRTVEHDLDAGLPEGIGAFDVVVCAHFHAPGLWPSLRAALVPGGLLAMETLTTRNVELGLPSPGARWLIRPGELLGAAEGLDVLLHAEAVSEGAHRARLLARRPAGTVLKL